MTNLEAARQNAREGADLGDLSRRYNDAHRATLVKRPSDVAQDLIDTMQAAILIGNRAMFEAAQQQLRALVEEL